MAKYQSPAISAAIPALLANLFFLISSLQARPWTNKEGGKFEGDLLGIENKAAVIQRTDGQVFRIPVLSLSLSDQQFIGKLKKESKIAPGLTIPLPDSIRSSLKGHYAFDRKDELGTDSSGSRPPKGPNDCKMDWAENGLLNGAASFNGRNSIFWMRKIMPLKNQPLTVSCWIRTENRVEQEIFASGKESRGIALHTEDRTVGLAYRWTKGKGIAEIKFSRRPVTDGRWHHLCGTLDGKGTLTLWVDGDKAGTRAGSLTPEEPLYGATLGSVSELGHNVRKTRTTKPFLGLIDEFMIFDRALADLEISELYSRYKAFAKD